MARKPTAKKGATRTKKSAAAAKAAVTPMRSTHEQIGVDDLKNLLRRCKSWGKQGSEITGQIGEAIKSAAENKNLDKKAFQIVRMLAKMEERNRLTTLACLDYYVEVLELDKGEQVEAPLKSDEPAEQRAGLHLAHDADKDGKVPASAVN